MKNLNHADKPPQCEWLTEKRGALAELLGSTGMRLDSVMAVLLGLKTEAQVHEMGRGLILMFDKTGKVPTPDEVMLGMLSIRRTGKFSLTAWAEPTGRNTTRKTRRRAG